jgi:3-oxoacyl-[acyl-carrier protein] reductase
MIESTVNSVSRLLVTGGDGALAQAIASEFRDHSWFVDAPSHQELDVTSVEQIEEYINDHGPYDCVVCNAGITLDALLMKQTPERWERVLQTNLKGATWCANYSARGMVQVGKGGSIIFIGSYASEHPTVGQSIYAASKAGLIGVMKSAAREWGSLGIRVNVILPGFMETPMTETLPSGVVERARQLHVLGEFNTPNRVAAMIWFLHETMRATSGQVFSLDSRIL